MGFILFVIALVLTGFVFAINIVIQPIYYIVTFKWKSGVKQLDKWFYKLALSIDQFGNVATATTLQLLLTKPLSHSFGEEDDTVSYVLACNRELGTLTALGRFIGWVLDKIDKDHLTKAINNKIAKDEEAILRYQQNKYFK